MAVGHEDIDTKGFTPRVQRVLDNVTSALHDVSIGRDPELFISATVHTRVLRFPAFGRIKLKRFQERFARTLTDKASTNCPPLLSKHGLALILKDRRLCVTYSVCNPSITSSSSISCADANIQATHGFGAHDRLPTYSALAKFHKQPVSDPFVVNSSKTQ